MDILTFKIRLYLAIFKIYCAGAKLLEATQKRKKSGYRKTSIIMERSSKV